MLISAGLGTILSGPLGLGYFAWKALGANEIKVAQFAVMANYIKSSWSSEKPSLGQCSAGRRASSEDRGASAEEGTSLSSASSGEITAIKINVRAEPTTRSDVQGQLVQQTQVQIHEKKDLGDKWPWYRISDGESGVEGWVYGRYLREREE